jgi:hypothetical protein
MQRQSFLVRRSSSIYPIVRWAIQSDSSLLPDAAHPLCRDRMAQHCGNIPQADQKDLVSGLRNSRPILYFKPRRKQYRTTAPPIRFNSGTCRNRKEPGAIGSAASMRAPRRLISRPRPRIVHVFPAASSPDNVTRLLILKRP